MSRNRQETHEAGYRAALEEIHHLANVGPPAPPQRDDTPADRNQTLWYNGLVRVAAIAKRTLDQGEVNMEKDTLEQAEIEEKLAHAEALRAQADLMRAQTEEVRERIRMVLLKGK